MIMTEPEGYRSKMQIAYDSLKERILTAKLRPGEAVSIGAVAQELGMSYIPVREAVKRLEGDGLLVTRPHRSPAVTEFKLEDLEEVLLTRGYLEAKAAELAMPRITPAKIATLGRLITESLRELERGNLGRVSLLDKEFHQQVYAECGNRFLQGLIQDLWGKSDRMLGVFTLVPMRAKESCDEHWQILDALKRRDRRRVVELVIRQKKRTLESLLKYLHGPPRR